MGDLSAADISLPRNYEVTIQNFPMIKNTVEIYKSAVFEAGGYKWKLVVHPNGNKMKKVKSHLSFYLALAERVELGWEVKAEFHLYLKTNYDHFPGLDFGTQKRCFHPLKLEHGLDECIDFDRLNGYIVGDSCIFGAKILSLSQAKTKGKAECLSMSKTPPVITHTWKIDKFSTKMNQECLSSEIFGDGNTEWYMDCLNSKILYQFVVRFLESVGFRKIQVYPKGRKDLEGTDLSVYLALANPTRFSQSYRIYAKVRLRIVEESKDRQSTLIGDFWFRGISPEQGWFKVDKFEGLKKCFPVWFGESDVFLVEAKLILLGTADAIIP